MGQTDLRYLKSLSNQYPTIATAATEIINLQAILSLPKSNRTFYHRCARGVRPVFTCAKKWIRCHQAENRG